MQLNVMGCAGFFIFSATNCLPDQPDGSHLFVVVQELKSTPGNHSPD